jgi:hypothetical protein
MQAPSREARNYLKQTKKPEELKRGGWALKEYEENPVYLDFDLGGDIDGY